MKFALKPPQRSSSPSPSPVGTVDFDVLRSRLESAVASPSVIAVTSATAEDGKEMVARGLAYSLVNTDYTTLLLDTSSGGNGLPKPPQRLTFVEAGRLLSSDSASAKLSVLDLSDLLLQKTTSKRHMETTFRVLLTKFDYVIVNTEFGGSTAFASSIIAAADAVLVTVKKGRRETSEDRRLAASLGRLGTRFLGAVVVDPTVIDHAPTITRLSESILGWHRNEPPRLENEHQHRGVTEWPK
jgi:Mrp family chromosome partitioning ATPase